MFINETYLKRQYYQYKGFKEMYSFSFNRRLKTYLLENGIINLHLFYRKKNPSRFKNTIISLTKSQLINVSFHLGQLKSKWNAAFGLYIYGIRQNMIIFNIDYSFYNIRRALLFTKQLSLNRVRILSVSNYNFSEFNGLTSFFFKKIKHLYYDGPGFNGLVSNYFSARKASFLNLELVQTNINLDINAFFFPSVILITSSNHFFSLFMEAARIFIPSIGIVDSDMEYRDLIYPLYGNISSLNFYVLYVYLFYLSLRTGYKLQRLYFFRFYLKFINYILRIRLLYWLLKFKKFDLYFDLCKEYQMYTKFNTLNVSHRMSSNIFNSDHYPYPVFQGMQYFYESFSRRDYFFSNYAKKYNLVSLDLLRSLRIFNKMARGKRRIKYLKYFLELKYFYFYFRHIEEEFDLAYAEIDDELKEAIYKKYKTKKFLIFQKSLIKKFIKLIFERFPKLTDLVIKKYYGHYIHRKEKFVIKERRFFTLRFFKKLKFFKKFFFSHFKFFFRSLRIYSKRKYIYFEKYRNESLENSIRQVNIMFIENYKEYFHFLKKINNLINLYFKIRLIFKQIILLFFFNFLLFFKLIFLNFFFFKKFFKIFMKIPKKFFILIKYILVRLYSKKKINLYQIFKKLWLYIKFVYKKFLIFNKLTELIKQFLKIYFYKLKKRFFSEFIYNYNKNNFYSLIDYIQSKSGYRVSKFINFEMNETREQAVKKMLRKRFLSRKKERDLKKKKIKFTKKKYTNK